MPWSYFGYLFVSNHYFVLVSHNVFCSPPPRREENDRGGWHRRWRVAWISQLCPLLRHVVPGVMTVATQVLRGRGKVYVLHNQWSNPSSIMSSTEILLLKRSIMECLNVCFSQSLEFYAIVNDFRKMPR